MMGSSRVTSSSFPLLSMIGGSVTLQENLELVSLDWPALRVVSGSVVIDSNSISTLTLTSLTAVEGSMFIKNELYASLISLPLLRSVGGNFVLSNLAVPGSSLPSLVSVGGDFMYESCPNAVSLGLGSLASITGSFSVNSNPSLNTINIGTVGYVGGDVYVCSNAATFVLPSSLRDVFVSRQHQSIRGLRNVDVSMAGSAVIHEAVQRVDQFGGLGFVEPPDDPKSVDDDTDPRQSRTHGGSRCARVPSLLVAGHF